MLLAVAGKVNCLPEVHRQAITLIAVTGSAAVAPWPSLGSFGEVTIVISTVLVGEVFARFLDQKRRSMERASDGPRPRPSMKESQMKFALDMSPTPTCIADERRALVYANPAALALFGYTEEDLLGQCIDVLLLTPIVNERDDTFKHRPGRRASTIQAKHGCEVKGVHKDGHTLDLNLSFKTAPGRKLFAMSFRNAAAEDSQHDTLSQALRRFPSDVSTGAMSKGESAVNASRPRDNGVETYDEATAAENLSQADSIGGILKKPRHARSGVPQQSPLSCLLYTSPSPRD